ncbi:MAG: hypothetical protein IPJ34_22405 [Myxococcales bacterium]|nr:hypothetical protein [Myxococcales bacterium]
MLAPSCGNRLYEVLRIEHGWTYGVGASRRLAERGFRSRSTPTWTWPMGDRCE